MLDRQLADPGPAEAVDRVERPDANSAGRVAANLDQIRREDDAAVQKSAMSEDHAKQLEGWHGAFVILYAD